MKIDIKSRIVFFILFFLLVSCNSIYRNTDNVDMPARWPDILREVSRGLKLGDERMAVIEQIDSVYRLVEDSANDADILKGPICRMKDNIEFALDNDTSFEFFFMMQATARNFLGLLMYDERILHCSCAIDLSMSGLTWITYSDEEEDNMCFAIYANSWESFGKYALLRLHKSDGDPSLSISLFIQNSIDNRLDDVIITAYDINNNAIGELYEKDLDVDTSGMEVGIKILSLPQDVMIDWLLHSSAMTISYNTSVNFCSLNGFPHSMFSRQVNECPRIASVLKEMGMQD